MTNPNDPISPCDKNTFAELQVKAVGMRSPYENETWKGLTKREYFAVMAMQGLLQGEHWIKLFSLHGGIYDWKHISEASLGISDALIAELNK